MNLKLVLPDREAPAQVLVEPGKLTITTEQGDWLQLVGLSLDHILHGGEAGVIREERTERRVFVERGLTLDDLDPALGPATLKARLAEHFILLGLPDIAEAVMLDYKAITGKTYQPDVGNGSDPQLAEDLALVEPLRDELLDESGKLVYGGQARIAEALGDIPNAGSYRNRILAVRDALERQAA